MLQLSILMGQMLHAGWRVLINCRDKWPRPLFHALVYTYVCTSGFRDCLLWSLIGFLTKDCRRSNRANITCYVGVRVQLYLDNHNT